MKSSAARSAEAFARWTKSGTSVSSAAPISLPLNTSTSNHRLAALTHLAWRCLIIIAFAAGITLHAAPVPVEGITTSGNQLTSVVINGKSYPQAQLAGATLTAFASSSTGCVLVPDGSAIPPSGTRAGLVGDWLLDSGIINPSTTPGLTAVSFPQPIVNRPGADIIIMEINPGATADEIEVSINGMTQLVNGSAWAATGFTTSSADQYGPSANVTTLAALEAATLNSVSSGISQAVLGTGIDLSDFGIPENGTVSAMGYRATSGNAVDPVFIGGITGTGTPPPGLVSLPYLETFTAGSGSFTTAPEWTATAGVYRNTIANTNATSTVSFRTNDLSGDPAPGFFLSSKFTLLNNTSTGNAVGFGLFGTNATFTGGVNLPYYIFDFRPSANVLRFIRVGINNTAFLPDSTLRTMTVNPAQPFFLEVEGTYENGVLRLKLIVRQGANSETFYVIDSEPLNVGYFGYRNRTGSGALTVDCDDFTLRHISTDSFTTTPAPFARPGEPYASNVAAVSDVGAAVTLSAVSLPPWMTFTPGPNGTGTLSGTPSIGDYGSHAVTLLATDNEAGSLQQIFHVSVLEPSGVFISEFLAENDSGLRDEDGDQRDWIELFNSGSEPADVGGFWLSDNPLLPKKWAIPAGVIIPARGFLVVFASGKNRAVAGAPLHTNFAISNNAGGHLSLAAPDGTIISSFTNYPAQRADRSYGAFGSYTPRGYLLTPTPGAPNDPAGYAGFVADTVFSTKRGFYTAPQTVNVTCATPGATLVYTTDGSTPSLTHGAQSPSPLTLNISATTVLRVSAFAPGLAPSGPDTQSYFFLEDIRTQQTNGAPPPGWPASPVNGQVLNYGMDAGVVNSVAPQQMKDALAALPALSVVTDLPNLFDPARGIYTNPYGREEGSECPISLELLQPDNTPGFHVNAGLRIRGGASRVATNPKHNFHVYFRGQYGAPKLKYPLFGDEGTDEYDRIDLRTTQVNSWHNGGSAEATYTRDEWNRATHGAMGQGYTRSRYYHLYINGHYWGIYGTQERADSDFAASYYGGKKADYDVMKTYVIPHRVDAADGDNAAWAQLFNAAAAGFASDAAYYAAQGLDAAGQPSPTLKPLVDIDSLIDYTLLRYYAADTDAPINTGVPVPKNFYAIRPRDGRFGYRFFTHDSESVMTSASADVTGTTSVGNTLPYFNPRWLSQQFAANLKYRLRFADRAQKHLFHGGALDNPVAIARWNDFRAQLGPAILAESARWGSTARSVSTWTTAMNNVENNFIALRRATLISQLRGRLLFPSFDAPSFSQHGGHAPANYPLTVTAPAGTTIFYTLNGADPMTPGAPAYASPIPLNGAQITVKARARHNSTLEWSALTEALFTLGAVPAAAGNLAISEIHYNPPGPSDDTEFIELVNRSAQRIDLAGVRLTGAVIFTFGNLVLEPGERICVVENEAAFEAAYGTSPIVAGQWSGALNNGGDTIILLDKDGNEIERVAYLDTAPWPTADVDGGGHTLTRVNVGATTSNPLNWRNSTTPGGNPGTTDTITFSGTPLADSDADSFPALIEHFLGTSDTASTISPITPARLPDGRLTITFPRRLGADDLTYTVEASTNLTHWTAPVTRLQHTQKPNGIALETWAANVPAPTPAYLRLRVARP